VFVALATLLVAGCGTGTSAWQGAAPSPEDVATLNELVVRVNEARAEGRDCGSRGWFDAAPPLRTEARLMGVAQAHSEDQRDRGVMSHQGSDGSGPSDRVSDAGYAWRTVGENVAWGYPSVAAVMDGWLGSPGHCANLMNPAFEELGVGLAGSYWTQVFAAPR
jgi:uncharacterized protein YkwD